MADAFLVRLTRLYSWWRLKRCWVPPARTESACGAEIHLSVFKDQTQHTWTASIHCLSSPQVSAAWWPWFCFSWEGTFYPKTSTFLSGESKAGQERSFWRELWGSRRIAEPAGILRWCTLVSTPEGSWESPPPSHGQEEGSHETEMDKGLLLSERFCNTTTCPKGVCGPRQASLPALWTEGHSVSFPLFAWCQEKWVLLNWHLFKNIGKSVPAEMGVDSSERNEHWLDHWFIMWVWSTLKPQFSHLWILVIFKMYFFFPLLCHIGTLTDQGWSWVEVKF